MKHIKYPLLRALLPLLALCLWACGGGDGDNDEPAPPSATLLVRTQIADGTTLDPTTTSITIEYNNLIALSAPGAITLNGSAVSASAEGMALRVAVSLEGWKDYTLVIPEGAVTLKDDARVKGPAVTIKFNTNAGIDRSKVVQAPVNPKATAQAKALYKNLLDGYGSRMLTGAMGGVGWETTYTDFLQAQTGKYPKVVGFDYIHLSWSPANWIDYGDITPVRTVADKGCIVQIQWHWNVPRSEGSSQIGCYKEDTSFNPANVLVEGTWERRVALADVEKLAGYLDLLQQAGIPVLWRPFHEAAGDYGWGAWFWWGTKGVEVTKQLYIWLYDQLTNVYGLNNLIWVWTVQTSCEGKPATLAQMQAAYPGDDYVDIVGTDIYPQGQLTHHTSEFLQVCETAQGHKMVTLSECGNLVDPDRAYADHALWLYFMQWYDMRSDGSYGFNNYAGPDQWLKFLASPVAGY